MGWVRSSALLLLMLLGWAGAVRGVRGGDAAVCRLRSRHIAGKLPFPRVKKAVGELLSETSLGSIGKLLGGFLKLGAEGLENHQLGVVLFHALAREFIRRFDDRDWLLFKHQWGCSRPRGCLAGGLHGLLGSD